jgi:hypothetical protein
LHGSLYALPIYLMLQEMRELQELQRTLYTFLHGMVTHDLSTILLAPTCRQYLETIMQLLLYTSCSHKDILLRKVRIPVILMCYLSSYYWYVLFFSSLRWNIAILSTSKVHLYLDYGFVRGVCRFLSDS